MNGTNKKPKLDPLEGLTCEILAEALRKNTANILGKVESGTPLSKSEVETVERWFQELQERENPTTEEPKQQQSVKPKRGRRKVD